MAKKLIIMQGIPGSGKSTWAKEFVKKASAEGLTSSIRSTDDQFMVDGIYRFDIKKISMYHVRNQQFVYEDCVKGIDVVIVDNTNIRAEHAMLYANIGKKNGYSVEVIRIDPGLVVAKQRNATRTADRRIPDHVIDKMHAQMEIITL